MPISNKPSKLRANQTPAVRNPIPEGKGSTRGGTVTVSNAPCGRVNRPIRLRVLMNAGTPLASPSNRWVCHSPLSIHVLIDRCQAHLSGHARGPSSRNKSKRRSRCLLCYEECRREGWSPQPRTLAHQCRRWRKPPLRQVADPSPLQSGEAPGGDGPDRLYIGLTAPLPSLVGPSQQFLRYLNGSVGAAPNRKRLGTQE